MNNLRFNDEIEKKGFTFSEDKVRDKLITDSNLPKEIWCETIFDNLKLIIKVLGCHPMGETILMYITNDENIIFSLLVDAYNKNGKLEDILNESNIKFIDHLYWTHPHKDHTKNMIKIYNKYCNEDTSIFCPTSLSDIKNISMECKKTYRFFKKLNRGKKKNYISYNEVNSSSKVSKITLSDSIGKSIPINILIFAPFSQIYSGNFDKENAKINEYSLGISIEICDFKYILFGDLQNRSMEFLKKQGFKIDEKVKYIKIPHHGSPESNKVLTLINDSIDDNLLCVSTEYKSSDLPKMEVLEQYSEKIGKNKGIYYTKKEQKENNKYGIISSEIDLDKTKEFLAKITLEGTAKKYTPIVEEDFI